LSAAGPRADQFGADAIAEGGLAQMKKQVLAIGDQQCAGEVFVDAGKRADAA
jgi:hypothetical protein